MSEQEQAKRSAESKISEALANQPKQDNEETAVSKEKRAEAEKTMKDLKTGEAGTEASS